VNETSRRNDLLDALRLAGREHGDALVLFRDVLSERMGLSAIEEKTLDLLEREGSLTAGQLASRTGLAPASVTGLIDRLVRKNFVRRVPHEVDRRRVRVEINQEHVDTFAGLLEDLSARFGNLHATYTDAELELIVDYVQHSVKILGAATDGLARPVASDRS
jgi:DNA-binding MarR family transcriptional regulator